MTFFLIAIKIYNRVNCEKKLIALFAIIMRLILGTSKYQFQLNATQYITIDNIIFITIAAFESLYSRFSCKRHPLVKNVLAACFSHTVTITDRLLMKLYDHTVNLHVWDSKEKLATRARFDRPKAFRLPQGKSG